MKIIYRNKKVEKQCKTPEREFRGNKDLIEWILYRMVQLKTFETLLDIKNLRDANFHALVWNRKYEIAIDALLWNRRSRRRIIFQPINGENIFEDMLNIAKLKTVTEIEIIEITENHYL